MATNSVDFLRTELINSGMDESKVASMSKKELNEAYSTLQEEIPFEVEDREKSPSTMEEALKIKYGSSEWQDFILSQLTADELSDGCPKCNGLRRVANLYLGPILQSGAKQVIITHGEVGRVVTVNYEITFDWTLDRPAGVFVNLDNNIHDTRTFCGLADCAEDQTIYGQHPAATAESKAESRALRKALMLNVVTAEEKITGRDNDIPTSKRGASISKPLMEVILAKVKAFNLNLESELQKANLPTKLSDLTIEEGRLFFDKVINLKQQKVT